VFWQRPVDQALSRLKENVHAPLRVVLWDGREVALSDDPLVTVTLKSMDAASALAQRSLLGLAEAYVEGRADVEGSVLEAIKGVEKITTSGKRRLYDAENRIGGHTKRVDRDSVRHHYDVSNEFYALWLDPRMVYSCAYFQREDDSLGQAQLQKLDHVCTKLRLAPGERFLDIGCGWGALVIRAAERYGVDATGITLSENQHRLANERIRAAGLEGRCRVVLEDYRDHSGGGAYDKIASVGMFEHVGLENLPVYFGKVRGLLREGGVFMNHGITTSDILSRSVGMGAGEFIDRYVFPNGELPHLHLVVREMSDQQLEIHDVECLRPHYAKTLALWSERFEARMGEAIAAANERTARIWRLYLAGCAHAFDQRWVSVYQILATKQVEPGRAPLPLTRDWMYRVP